MSTVVHHINALGKQTIGPKRGVASINYQPVEFGKPLKATIILDCGHTYEDVELAVDATPRHVYRCGQCRTNNPH